MAIVRGEGGEDAVKPPITAGLIVLNKPSGPTSRELVNQVARLIPRTKVGHAGTLDPLASGILIICVGTATRLTDEIHDLSKSYRTVIHLGARSDTHDALGSIVAVDGPRVPGVLELDDAIEAATRKSHATATRAFGLENQRHSAHTTWPEPGGPSFWPRARYRSTVSRSSGTMAAPGARDRLHQGHVHPLDCPRRRRGARLRRLCSGARAHQDRSVHAGGLRWPSGRFAKIRLPGYYVPRSRRLATCGDSFSMTPRSPP